MPINIEALIENASIRRNASGITGCVSDYIHLIQLSIKIHKPFEVTKGKTIIGLSLLSISQLMVNLSKFYIFYTVSKYITIEIVTNGRSIGQTPPCTP